MEKQMTKEEEGRALSGIAKRYRGMHAQGLDFMTLLMYLDYAHRDMPLDIAGLLAASDGDLAHDVSGIICNFDQATKTMQNCFVPRYAR